MNNQTTNNATRLQAKILAINTINQHTKLIADQETNQLKNLIGVNPLKVDGSFKAKYTHTKKDIERTQIKMFGFNWWVHTQYYFTNQYGYFSAVIRTNISGGGADQNGVNKHCIYETRTVDLFKIDKEGNFCENNRVIEELKQYNEKDLLQLDKEIKEAAEVYRQVRNKMPHQFTDVLNIERLTR